MATIFKVVLPNNTPYEFEDRWARQQIEAITGGSALVFKGVSTTPLTDGGTENPTVDGTVITEKTIGDIYFYGTGEYIWNGTAWNELGNLESLGEMAYKNTSDMGALAWKDSASVTASSSYQPAGTISALTFTGSTLTMSTSYTPEGTVSVSASHYTTSAFAVTTASGTNTYTPAGSVSAPTFTGTTTTLSMSTSYTPEGSISFPGTAEPLIVGVQSGGGLVSYKPEGSVSAPTISVSTAGTTTPIKNPTAKQLSSDIITAAPGATAPANAITQYAVTNEILYLYQVGYNTTDTITTTNVTVKTGDASYQASTPTFTGTSADLYTEDVPDLTSGVFSGTTATVSMSTNYQPGGTNSTATFTGTGVRLVTSSISIPDTFTGSLTGTTATITVSRTPEGTINTPTFTGTTATITVSGTAS